ncbi:MAG: hypothetical protein NTY45_06445 [Elusimicrobia bacterium]|nr:hypothetical protein [Elusimicrobiota bacterium]
MRRKKLTASNLVFESAVEVMSDVFDFTIERHAGDQAAEEIYSKMRAALADARRNLRGLLKKPWFKGPERERCLARARELRGAELMLGYTVKAARAAAETNEFFLENAASLPGMPELMGRFKIKISGGRKK